ncbi:MAG: hypothetical protein VX367_07275, partial [SAR324 cluster bacterium]|nr:hypothetical protein [SAR324 cluster bacterium]
VADEQVVTETLSSSSSWMASVSRNPSTGVERTGLEFVFLVCSLVWEVFERTVSEMWDLSDLRDCSDLRDLSDPLDLFDT